MSDSPNRNSLVTIEASYQFGIQVDNEKAAIFHQFSLAILVED